MANFREIYKQLCESLRFWRYYFYRAFLFLENQYKDTKLGIVWKPLSTLIGVFFIAILWTFILDRGGSFYEFYIYLLTGFVLWTLLSSAITVGGNSFVMFKLDINSEKQPLYFYSFEALIRVFMDFLMSLIVISVLMILTMNFTIVFRIPLLIFVLFNTLLFAIGISSILSVIVLMWRDTQQIVQSIMRVMFFMTPIIWSVDRVIPYENYLWLNPFYSYLYLFRACFMNYNIEYYELIINLALSIFIFFIGLWFVNRKEKIIRHKSLAP